MTCYPLYLRRELLFKKTLFHIILKTVQKICRCFCLVIKKYWKFDSLIVGSEIGKYLGIRWGLNYLRPDEDGEPGLALQAAGLVGARAGVAPPVRGSNPGNEEAPVLQDLQPPREAHLPPCTKNNKLK